MATAAQKQAELQAVKAERAQVEAELARIRGQSAPAPTSNQVARVGQSAPIVPYASSSGTDTKKLLLAAAAIGLGLWLWKRRK
jgi:hypothetical protein